MKKLLLLLTSVSFTHYSITQEHNSISLEESDRIVEKGLAYIVSENFPQKIHGLLDNLEAQLIQFTANTLQDAEFDTKEISVIRSIFFLHRELSHIIPSYEHELGLYQHTLDDRCEAIIQERNAQNISVSYRDIQEMQLIVDAEIRQSGLFPNYYYGKEIFYNLNNNYMRLVSHALQDQFSDEDFLTMRHLLHSIVSSLFKIGVSACDSLDQRNNQLSLE